MSTISQFPAESNAEATAAESTHLAGLLPSAVIIVERRAPGDPRDLLPSEARYVARAVPKRIQEFAAGRACARAALARLGVAPAAIDAAADRSPQWPAGFLGSITHTEGFCAAAVASREVCAAVGLDTERVGAPTPDLWPTIAGDRENRWLRSLSAGDQAAAITLLFSAKEAFYKCQYPSTLEWLDFHDLHIDVAGWGAPHGALYVTPLRSTRFTQRRTVPLAGRYQFHDSFISVGFALLAESAPDQ